MRIAFKSILLTGVVFLAPAFACSSRAGTTFSLVPETLDVITGDDFKLSLMLSAEADTFSNWQTIFCFDPTVIQFVTAQEGAIYSEQHTYVFSWFYVGEESLGTNEVWDCIFPSMSYLIAPGQLCWYKFYALAPGQTAVHFLHVALMDIYREPMLPIDWRDGFVRVCDPTTSVADRAAASEAMTWSRLKAMARER